jgi:8-oxo-dGTP diphosphatase
MAYTYEYPRPSLTVDCIIFGLDESSRLKVLLIQRGHDPFKDAWALPGGFVDEKETLEEAALRELKEETGVSNVFIEQLFTFGNPGRDPRGRVVTIAYYALINLGEHKIGADTDAQDVKWFPINKLPPLAFDHAHILELAITRLRGKVRYQPVGFELLPPKFTLTHLQKLYEIILDKPLNKRNFRTKVLKMDILKEENILRGLAHRPAQLYSFDEAKYQDYLKQGFNFEISGFVKEKGEIVSDENVEFVIV